jgi:hypothetical protein
VCVSHASAHATCAVLFYEWEAARTPGSSARAFCGTSTRTLRLAPVVDKTSTNRWWILFLAVYYSLGLWYIGEAFKDLLRTRVWISHMRLLIKGQKNSRQLQQRVWRRRHCEEQRSWRETLSQHLLPKRGGTLWNWLDVVSNIVFLIYSCWLASLFGDQLRLRQIDWPAQRNATLAQSAPAWADLIFLHVYPILAWVTVADYILALHWLLLVVRCAKYFRFHSGLSILSESVRNSIAILLDVATLFLFLVALTTTIVHVWLGQVGARRWRIRLAKPSHAPPHTLPGWGAARRVKGGPRGGWTAERAPARLRTRAKRRAVRTPHRTQAAPHP